MIDSQQSERDGGPCSVSDAKNKGPAEGTFSRKAPHTTSGRKETNNYI